MRNKFLETGEYGYHPIKKIKVVFSGLRFAVLHDFSVMYKLVISSVILVAAMIYNDLVDVTLILVATGIMVASEIFNTAIEAMCDYMKTDYDEKIGIIKDVSAAATGVAIFVWLVVMVSEATKLLPHLKAL